MFAHYRFLLKRVLVRPSCVHFFNSTLCQIDHAINPTSFFRLYDPYFTAPHFLPIEFKDSNQLFSWPQAVMKSIRPEIEPTSNYTDMIAQELTKMESIEIPIDPLKRAIHFLDLANLYIEILSLNKSEEVLKKSIDILSSQNSLESAKLLSESYRKFAITKQIKEEYSIAISFYQKSIQYSEKVFRGQNHPSQAQLYAILGMAYATVDMPIEFEKCYQKIITSMKTCFFDSPKMWVDFESSLAVIYQRQGKFDEALLLHDRCYQTYSRMQNNRINASIEKLNLASTLMLSQDFAKAKNILHETEDFFVKQLSVNPVILKIISSNLDICSGLARHPPLLK